MQFAPNSGYAFAVGGNTWHSLATMGPEVPSRDSILLTYFVDSGVFRMLRNRSRRLGNFVLNELKRGRRSRRSSHAGPTSAPFRRGIKTAP